MAAMRVDGENLRSGAHQKDILVADVAEQGLAGEVTWCNALCEIRPSGRGLLFGHVHSLRRTSDRRAALYIWISGRHTKYLVATPRNSRRVSALPRKQPSMRLAKRSVDISKPTRLT